VMPHTDPAWKRTPISNPKSRKLAPLPLPPKSKAIRGE
jgi:hypothetical protein